MERNRDREWFLRGLAGGRPLDPLCRMAAERADAGGGELPPAHRSMRQEVFEELADAANYLVWWLQRVCDGTEDADPERLMRALRLVLEAAQTLDYPTGRVPRTHMMAGARRPAPPSAFRVVDGGDDAS